MPASKFRMDAGTAGVLCSMISRRLCGELEAISEVFTECSNLPDYSLPQTLDLAIRNTAKISDPART